MENILAGVMYGSGSWFLGGEEWKNHEDLGGFMAAVSFVGMREGVLEYPGGM